MRTTIVRTANARRVCSSGSARGISATRNYSDLLTDSPESNITERVANKVGRKLHLIPDHPLNTIKRRIEQHFAREVYKGIDGADVTDTPFQFFDDLSPVVSTQVELEKMLQTL